ncbi:hypothetical protein AB0D59_42065 [Streptomyces sp. NPDC048417]
MYWQLDYMLVYGQYEVARALGPFYAVRYRVFPAEPRRGSH